MRKSLRETLASNSERRAARESAVRHAQRMADAGLLSPGEVADFTQAVISDHVDTLDGEDFDGDLKSGKLDKLLELSGYEDGEDPDEADGRRQGVVAKVAGHVLLDAVDQGLMKPKDALEQLVEYLALPDGHEADPHAAAAKLWRQIHSGKRLRLADKILVST
jgi:hypothetical protein